MSNQKKRQQNRKQTRNEGRTCVVAVAVGVVHPNRLVCRVVEHLGPVRHHRRLVQRRLAVDEHDVSVLQMAPHFLAGAVEKRPRDRAALALVPRREVHEAPLLVLHVRRPRVRVRASLDLRDDDIVKDVRGSESNCEQDSRKM